MHNPTPTIDIEKRLYVFLKPKTKLITFERVVTMFTTVVIFFLASTIYFTAWPIHELSMPVTHILLLNFKPTTSPEMVQRVRLYASNYCR